MKKGYNILITALCSFALLLTLVSILTMAPDENILSFSLTSITSEGTGNSNIFRVITATIFTIFIYYMIFADRKSTFASVKFIFFILASISLVLEIIIFNMII